MSDGVVKFDRIENATELMRALDLTLRGELHAQPHPLHHLLCPWCAPVNLLPYLAWERSVDHWNDAWPERIKRKVIANAPRLHAIKGSVAAVEFALASIEADCKLKEWHETGSAPNTFQITVAPPAAFDLLNDGTMVVFSDALVDELRRVVDTAKPLREHYDLTLETKMRSTVHLTGAMAAQQFSTQRMKARQRNYTASSRLTFTGAMATQQFSNQRLKAVQSGVKSRSSLRITSALSAQQFSYARFTATLPTDILSG